MGKQVKQEIYRRLDDRVRVYRMDIIQKIKSLVGSSLVWKIEDQVDGHMIVILRCSRCSRKRRKKNKGAC